MNTYDPRDGMIYRHLDQRPNVDSHSLSGSPPVNRLPAGYANGSPSTYLGSSHRGTSAA